MSVGAADRYVTLGVAEAHSSLISAQSSYCSPGNLTLCLEITEGNLTLKSMEFSISGRYSISYLRSSNSVFVRRKEGRQLQNKVTLKFPGL